MMVPAAALASLDTKALLSLEQLNERFWHWLETVYHPREHASLRGVTSTGGGPETLESTGLGTTLLLRWQRDIDQIRQLPPATDMRRLFFHRLKRLVRRNSTF